MSLKLKLKNKFIPVNTPKIFSQEKNILIKLYLQVGYLQRVPM